MDKLRVILQNLHDWLSGSVLSGSIFELQRLQYSAALNQATTTLSAVTGIRYRILKIVVNVGSNVGLDVSVQCTIEGIVNTIYDTHSSAEFHQTIGCNFLCDAETDIVTTHTSNSSEIQIYYEKIEV